MCQSVQVSHLNNDRLLMRAVRPFGDEIKANITHLKMLFKWISSCATTRDMVIKKCPHMNTLLPSTTTRDMVIKKCPRMNLLLPSTTSTNCGTYYATSYGTRFIR